MPQFIVSILKYLALKYAAKLVLDAVIDAAEKGAKSTSTTIDDEVVKILKDEKDYLIKAINGAIN